MKRHSITIIGMGPRGLSIFERVAAIARVHALPFDLHVVEPGECGPGAHPARQPQHLLINTIASQVTIFPAPGAVAHAPACATPSLTEWARRQGYRRFGDNYVRLGGSVAGAEVGELDYLPRGLLGEYLAWAYQQLAACLPAGIRLTHHRQRARDLWRGPDGGNVVELDGGDLVRSDFVFLTTGHGRNLPGDQDARLSQFALEHAHRNDKLAFIRHLYPLHQLARIRADARVAIEGMGLSAHDVIAELTVGRGGGFARHAQGLRYRRSGREPQLLLCSRNCLPYAARGVNQKGLDGRHRPRFLTPEAIAALRRRARAARGNGQLDFDAELLPLLQREMAYVYRSTLAGKAADPAAFVLTAADEAWFDQLLFPLRERRFASPGAFRDYFVATVREDLAEARRGNVGSAVKAATDALRDLRPSLQAALEHGGLTPASHRQFLQVYHPAINRIAFGPPLRRNEELLALLDAGVVELAPGPHGAIEIDEHASTFVLHTAFGAEQVRRPFDVLLHARLDVFFPETDDSPFCRNLLRRGTVRPYYNGAFHPGGIDIDAACHPVGAGGEAAPDIWAVGYLVEGAHYYTHALPRPGLCSRQVLDADRCVGAMFAQMAEAGPGQPSSGPVRALCNVADT